MGGLGQIFGQKGQISGALRRVLRFFEMVDKEFDRLDILVNNAGVARYQKVGEMTPEDWHRNIDLNLNGAFYCAHEALRRFAARDGGFIVNVSSLAGKNAFSGGAAYNASEFGLNGFTEALMLDPPSRQRPGLHHARKRGYRILRRPVQTAPHRHQLDDSPEDVAEAVVLVLQMPVRTMVSAIEMGLPTPKKQTLANYRVP
jgi:3-oxoacyl-[acyl-carrier protein] reductase